MRKFVDRLASDLNKDLPGYSIGISQPIIDGVNDMIGGAHSPLVAKIYGDDLNELRAVGAQIVDVLYGIQGTSSASIFQEPPIPQIEIKLDHEKAARFGINMTDVQNVKAAIRKYDSLALRAQLGADSREVLSGNQLRLCGTHRLVRTARDFAANCDQQFLAGHGCRSAFHNHEAARDVRNLRSFQRRCAGSECQGERCQHGIAGAGHVHGLIAAVNRDSRQFLVPTFKQDHAVFSARDQ